MSSIEIVRLQDEHLSLLTRFFSQINSPEYIKDFSPHPFDEEFARFVCRYTGEDVYYAILMNEINIIAYFMLRGWDEGYDIPSLGLCILKEYQGRGIGRSIMYFLEASAKLKGCQKIMLKVKKDNVKARNLYTAQGYVFNDYSTDSIIGYKDLSIGRSA